MNYWVLFGHILVISGLIFLIIQRQKDVFGIRHVIISLSIKCICGILIGLLYLFYYHTGDTLIYAQEAGSISQYARNNFTGYVHFLFTSDIPPYDSAFMNQPRALWMGKITSIFYLLTDDNYWISGIYMSLLAWWGQWQLSKAFYFLFPASRFAILFSFLYFPSAVFWSSGITKESLAIWFFGVTLATVIYAKENFGYRQILVAICMFWFLWKIKYYYAALLILSLVPVIISMLNQQVIPKNRIRQYIVAICITALALFVVIIHPNLQPGHLPEVIHDNYIAFISKSDPGKCLVFPEMKASWGSIIRYFPQAAGSAFFRPFLWETWSAVSFTASLENAVVLLLFISSFLGFRRWRHIPTENKVWILSGCIYCLVLGGFLALSAPNFGTLIRYRVGFLSILMYLITATNPIFYGVTNRIRTDHVALQKKV